MRFAQGETGSFQLTSDMKQVAGEPHVEKNVKIKQNVYAV